MFRESDERFMHLEEFVSLCPKRGRRRRPTRDGEEMDLTTPEHRAVIGRFLAEAEIGFLYVDSSHEIVDSNETVAEVLDIGDDSIGADLSEIDPSFGPELLDAIEAAVRGDRIVEQEITVDDGTTLWFRVVPGYSGVGVLLRDATEDFEMRRDLRRSNRILETLEDGVYTLDEAFVITSVNEAVTEMTGYDREELVGSHSSMLAGSETLDKAEEILTMLRGDGSDIGMIESSIVTANGESLPIETRFSSIDFDDGRRGRVGVIRDVTDRNQNESVLRELNRSARRLLRADDTESVFETIVDVITSVWPDTTVAAYSFDRAESNLVPVATSGGEHDECGPGSPVWNAFTTGEGGSEMAIDPAREIGPDDDASRASFRTVDRSDGDDPSDDESTISPRGRVIERSTETAESSRRTLYATLDGYGLFRVYFGSEGPAGNVEEPVELLAANAVAALDSVERETELSRNREQLERLHELNNLLRRINGELVDAETLEEIAEAVCDTLVEADPVEFVWIGETYRTGGDPTPIARAGESDGHLEDRFGGGGDGSAHLGGDDDDRSGDPDDHPSLRAIRTGDSVRVLDVSDGLRSEPWRERALARGYQSVMSVPLSYDDLCYGVLSVYADRQSVFDGEFGDLLVELGDNVANAISSLETKRSLRSGSLVELELRIDGADALLSRAASAFGEPLHVEGTVPQGGGRSLVYLTTEGDDPGAAGSVNGVESIRRMSEGPNGRIEASVSEETVADRLSALGGVMRRMATSPEHVDVTVTFPRPVDVRRIIEHLAEQYGHVELVSRRDRTRGDHPVTPGGLSNELTDRQREAVETAYLGGYFDWPRASTGEEIATAMEITQPTFNRHLRTAERKLLGSIFGGTNTDE